MGVVFGKQAVAEPAYEVLCKRSSALSYEVRKYGERFAAEVRYPTKPNGEDSDNTPFSLLAKYIGVFGTPENEGQVAISMTAPVVKEGHNTSPVKISMTAPVMKEGDGTSEMTMAFILPAEFDSMSKIPKPTNPAVHVKEIPSAVGVVHQYSGSYSDDLSREKAQELAEQLRKDGLEKITDEYALQHFQFWGYNPPFTIPMFRRNEIWIELSKDEVDQLVNGVNVKNAN